MFGARRRAQSRVRPVAEPALPFLSEEVWEEEMGVQYYYSVHCESVISADDCGGAWVEWMDGWMDDGGGPMR